MSEKNPDRFLSKTERKRFDALATSTTIKEASQKLGIKTGTLYNWKQDLLKRHEFRRGWINAVLSQKKRSRLLKNFLSKKEEIKGLKEEDEDEE